MGKSGCGKTTVIFNLLVHPGWLDYNHLYVLERVFISKNTRFLEKVSMLA